MSVIIIKTKISGSDAKKASEEYGSYIKIVADIKREVITIGGEWHADGERLLLENGSNQKDLWGGGIDLTSKRIDYNSLINIRPEDNNDSMEILDSEIRKKFLEIVKNKFQL